MTFYTNNSDKKLNPNFVPPASVNFDDFVITKVVSVHICPNCGYKNLKENRVEVCPDCRIDLKFGHIENI